MAASKDRQQSSSSGQSQKSVFRAMLDKWKMAEDGSAPFEVAKPRKSSRTKEGNEQAIKDYKKKNKSRTPSRRKVQGKPAHLKNIFGPKAGEESAADYKPPVFKKTAETVFLIRDTISNNFFFDGMDCNDLPVFIDAFEPFKVARGEQIITQGDKVDYFYIVGKHSKVAFEVSGKQVGEAGEGSSFGELALLYACPRAATVIALSPKTKLYRVGQRTFRSLLQKQTKRKEAEKMKLLKAVDFLSEISSYDLKRLGRAMTLKVFEPGDCLVKKGDEGDAFYMVHEGQVEVTDISVGSTKFDDTTLEPGAYFGERALATNEPRAANVIAKTHGSAFRINRKTFEKVLGKFSRVIMKSQDRRIMVSGFDTISVSWLCAHLVAGGDLNAYSCVS
jgi:cAMP-dependent protein kinase regulator